MFLLENIFSTSDRSLISFAMIEETNILIIDILTTLSSVMYPSDTSPIIIP